MTNGVSAITLDVTNAAGMVTTTNITISQGSVQFFVNSTPAGDGLYQATGTVTGEISDNSYSVTVNGTPATVSGSPGGDAKYSWEADSVSIQGQGTAVFDAVAGNGSQTVNNSTDVEKGVGRAFLIILIKHMKILFYAFSLFFAVPCHGTELSTITNGLYLAIQGWRHATIVTDSIRSDDELAWGAFSVSTNVDLLYPYPQSGIRIKMTGPDGEEVQKTALGKSYGVRWDQLHSYLDNDRHNIG